MADFTLSSTEQMIAMVQTYLEIRHISGMKFDIQRIPDDSYTYNKKYTRGIMVIPKDIFDVGDNKHQLMITGFHVGSTRNHFQQDHEGTPASIRTWTGDEDESPVTFYIKNQAEMNLKLDGILKIRTKGPSEISEIPKRPSEIPKNLAETLQKIYDVLCMIEYNTQRPEWDKDSKWRHGIHETIPAPVVRPQP